MQLSLGDFVAARRSLKKALFLGSQQPLDRQAIKKAYKYGDRAGFIPLLLILLRLSYLIHLYTFHNNSLVDGVICFCNFFSGQGLQVRGRAGGRSGQKTQLPSGCGAGRAARGPLL